VSGWAYAGLAAVGLTLGSIVLLAGPMAILWMVVAVRIGNRGETLAKEMGT